MHANVTSVQDYRASVYFVKAYANAQLFSFRLTLCQLDFEEGLLSNRIRTH